jgi:hypothetical protein
MSSYPTSTKKANLRLLSPEKPADLKLGGLAPSSDMKPGEYVAVCENAWREVGKKIRIVWQFRVIEGEHTGTSLRKWLFPADAGGSVSPFGYYVKICELSLGRPLRADDDLNNPGAIFSGRIFRVTVGYRKTLKPKGGLYSDKNTQFPKDERDRLRVHELVERVEL